VWSSCSERKRVCFPETGSSPLALVHKRHFHNSEELLSIWADSVKHFCHPVGKKVKQTRKNGIFVKAHSFCFQKQLWAFYYYF
jgi:hypothetical protein